MEKATKRSHIYIAPDLGAKIADRVTTLLGSWNFILFQSGVLFLWILLNSINWFYHWDSAPFILLNLCLSFQAAFTGPIVLLSQNRQSEKDHLRDNLEAQEIEKIFGTHELLLTINQQQLQLLSQQNDMLALLQQKTAELQTMVEKKPRTRS